MIDPSLFALHDDETLAGMHGMEVAEVATLRAKAAAPSEKLASAHVSAPPIEAAPEVAPPPKRSSKPKPAAETEHGTGQTGPAFTISVPYDAARTTRGALLLDIEAALKAAAAKLPPHLRPGDHEDEDEVDARPPRPISGGVMVTKEIVTRWKGRPWTAKRGSHYDGERAAYLRDEFPDSVR